MAKGIIDRNTYKKIRYDTDEKVDEFILNLEQIQRREFNQLCMETEAGFRKNNVTHDPFYAHNERVETKTYKHKKLSQKEIEEDIL